MNERPKLPLITPLHAEVIQRAINRVKADENLVISTSNMDLVSAETYKRLFNKLIRPGDVVLNIGAGFAVDPTRNINHLNETVLKSAKEKEAHLVAVDINHENLRSHKDLRELTGIEHLDAVQADGLHLPMADSSVRGIVSSNLINCPDLKINLRDQADGLLDEAWRVLKPGGFVILSSFGYVIEDKMENGELLYNDDITEGNMLPLREIEQMLESKGFSGIAELEVDDDQYDLAMQISEGRTHHETGGFIAYKPRESVK